MSDLENRLAAALTARAETVAPEDLTPSQAPAVVVPLRARVRPSVYVAASAVIAAAVVIAVSVGGHTDNTPSPPITQSPSPLPTSPAPTATPAGPAATEVRRQVPVAEKPETGGPLDLALTRFYDGGADTLTYRHSITVQDGPTIALEGAPAKAGMVEDGQARLVITPQDGTSETFVFAAGPAPELDTTPIVFNGEGPVGYLVNRPEGGDYLAATLILDQGTELMGLETKTVDEGAPVSPFGLGSLGGAQSGSETFVAADRSGLYTAYFVTGQPPGQVTVVRWGITGPAAEPQLTTTSLGTACADDPTSVTRYARC